MANSASERTKRNLAAVLKEKMAKKPLEQITIQELTEACGMQRRAFYYHFEDRGLSFNSLINESRIAFFAKPATVHASLI